MPRRTSEIIEKMKGGLIVSCQAYPDEPIYTEDIVLVMARAALWAGAVGIRANSPRDIRLIKSEIDLPIIALYKMWFENTDVFITPTLDGCRQLIEAGADIIALDCTFQINHEGKRAIELLPRLKKAYPDVLVFADVSTIEEAREAVRLGADIVAPTLYGYTKETAHIEGADYRMFGEFCRELNEDAYVFMEGHIYTPEDAMKCIFLGAHAVVVGGAITRPHLTAKRYVDLLSGYQDNWRNAERSKHVHK